MSECAGVGMGGWWLSDGMGWVVSDGAGGGMGKRNEGSGWVISCISKRGV